MKKIILILLAVFVAYATNAQQRGTTDVKARGGANGIYITNPFTPCSPKKPNAKGAVRYKLERKETGGTWQTLGTYNCPTSEGELTNNYHRYFPLALAKEFTDPNNILRLWQEYNRTPNWDSINYFFYDRVAALAMYYQFVDTTGRMNVNYVYQISELDKNDKAVSVMVTNPVSYPNNNVFTTRPKSSAVEGTQIQAYIVWNQENTSRPVFYKIYRKLGTLGEFEFLQNSSNISRTKNTDKFSLEYRDRSIGANQIYFYYCVPYDAYGNSGNNSDTVLVKTYETKDILTPQYFIASSLKNGKGVLLNWKLANTQSVSGIEVFRCDSYEGTYKKIGVASETDTSFADAAASPAQVYYYYLQMIDRFQHTSVRTPRTAALFEDLTPPRPPRYVTVAPDGANVKLTWTTSEKNITGYYVYRSLGHDTVYTMISGLIPAKDSLTVYVDETNNLKSQLGYTYTVKQENTSHVLSKFSYPVYLQAQLKAADAPTILHLQVGAGKKGAMLFWDNLQNANGVMGYKLFKRKKGDAEFKALIEAIIPVSTSYYADTLLEVGNVYEYALQTVLVSGNTSAMSEPVAYTFGNLSVVVPTGLTVAKAENGVALNWNETDAKRVKEIQIFRVERGANSPLKLNTLNANETKYTDLTSTKGKSYFYYLLGIGFDGTESQKSDVVFITIE